MLAYACDFFLTTKETKTFFWGLDKKNIPQGLGAYFYELNEYRKR